MGKLSHIDEANRPAMVDVGGKTATHRTACAEARVELPTAVQEALTDGDITTPKGPVFHTAIIAGTMAAKKTHELIPFCHPLSLNGVRIDIQSDGTGELVVRCQVSVDDRTGVEMEALTGAATAALTIYDMCKAMSHDIVIRDVRLIEKTGGKSGVGGRGRG